MVKRRLALAQFANSYGSNVALPYAVGLLWAYARARPAVKDEWGEPTFLYKKERVSKALGELGDPLPDVLGLSCYIWNWEYNRALARAVKEKSPFTTVLYGGVHVPDHPTKDWFDSHPEVDFLIHGEGELAFARFLEEYAGGRDWSTVPNFSSRELRTGRAFPPVSELRSPYLDGVFDKLLPREVGWTVLQETNRGCPYFCSFCVAEGSLITTPSGEKRIESILDGESVLGWDETQKTLSWGRVERLVSLGEAAILRLETEGSHIEVTKDHELFTQRGWLPASEIREGDALLLNLRGGEIETRTHYLFEGVRAKSDQSIEARGSEPHEKKRGRGEAIETIERETSTRRDRPIHVHSGGTETDRRDCENKAIGAGQPDEKLRNNAAGDRDKESKRGLCSPIGEVEGRQSDVVWRPAREGEEGIGRSGGGRALQGESIDPSQSLRGTSSQFFSGEQPPLSLRGGRVPQSREAEPRLCPYVGGEEGNPRSRDLLASRSNGPTRGGPRLRAGGLVSVDNLGGRSSQSEDLSGSEGVRWSVVRSVSLVGVRRVYDLVNISPTSSFFANGLLVHNCQWGQSTLNKIRQFDADRVKEEIYWFGRKRISYLEGADANFGILARDEEIAEALVKAKEKWGYPEKFRAAFAKYSNDTIAERIFRIAKMLHKSEQLKAVTLALQSTNEDTLDFIKRKNIAMSGFKELQERYRKEDIPTYTEIILALPGETYESFKKGLDAILDGGAHRGISIYPCVLLPNSEMSEPAYVERFKIKSVRMRAMLLHGTPNPDAPDEYQDTVIGTRDMPYADWERAYMLSWAVQALHALGLTTGWALRDRDALLYTEFYEALLNIADDSPESVLGRVVKHTRTLLRKAVAGGSWDNVLEGFGEVSWPPDEGGFLMICKELPLFYEEARLMGMPEELVAQGPPPIPPGREGGYGKALWYGKRGDVLKSLRDFCKETQS